MHDKNAREAHLASIIVGIRRRESNRGVTTSVSLEHGDVTPIVGAKILPVFVRVQEQVVEQIPVRKKKTNRK